MYTQSNTDVDDGTNGYILLAVSDLGNIQLAAGIDG